MTQTAVITGASGFLGRQVLQAFKQAGWNAVGTAYSRANPPSLREVDLSEQAAVESLLDEVRYAIPSHPGDTRAMS